MPPVKKRAQNQEQSFRAAGFVFGIVLFLLTLTACFIGGADFLKSGAVPRLQYPLMAVGVLLALLGLLLWHQASKRFGRPGNDRKRKLITDGAYRIVRHPMYLALTLVCDGAVLCNSNLWLLLLLPVFHAYLYSIAKEEDRELAVRYGSAWEAYKSSVPSVFPTAASLFSK